MKSAFKALALLPLLSTSAPAADWTPIFNGRDFSGWTRVIQGQAPGADPQQFFQVHDSRIALYRDTPADQKVPFGYLRYDTPLSRYQLRFEYRWLEKRFAPRKEALRDAGVLYHISGPDKVWPACAECQIQEGDTGDLVFLGSRAFTFLNPEPDQAAPGLGTPGMLPEQGGFPFDGGPNGYVGRYPVADRAEGWNQVEVTVQGADYAVHKINGTVRSRLSHLRRPDGSPLGSGLIALQLEGAEMEYRDIELREIQPPLRLSSHSIALSAVKDVPSQAQVLTLTNTGDTAVPLDISICGRDADAFKLASTPANPSLKPGDSLDLTISFKPTRSNGRHSAGLRLGGDAIAPLIPLQGIALPRFEGNNEPPLQSLCHALGCPVDVGGAQLKLDPQAATIGDSIQATHFRAKAGTELRLLPLARFSPAGAQAFGIAIDEKLRLLDQLANRSKARPDAHQCLFPPLASGKQEVKFTAPEAPFALYLGGPHHRCATDPALAANAPVPFTARIYPVSFFLGSPVENAYLIGFEEASNGDYQDAIFLLTGAEAITP